MWKNLAKVIKKGLEIMIGKTRKQKIRTFILLVLGLTIGYGLTTVKSGYALIHGLSPTVSFQDIFANLASQSLPAVVNISATRILDTQPFSLLPPFMGNDPSGNMFRQLPMENQRQTIPSLGSGFIYSSDGFIITNNHVISKTENVKVILQDGRQLDAIVYARDEKTDVAILKVDVNEKLPTLPMGNSDTMRVGDWIMAIGNPFGLGGTVTIGIISALSRDINKGLTDGFIQTDASINRGNSGGPMINLKGEVIGMNTAIYSPNGGNVGIGFALPTSMLQGVVQDLIKHKEVIRGWIGIQMQPLTEAVATALGRQAGEGTLVVGVLQRGPAEKAGVQVGDLIIKINNTHITGTKTLPRLIATEKPGVTITLTVLRNGKEIALQAIIEQFPKDEQAIAFSPKSVIKLKKAIQYQEKEVVSMGAKITPITPELLDIFNLPKDSKGVIITGVKNNMPASHYGMEAGIAIESVNLMPATPESLEDAFKAHREKKIPLLIQFASSKGHMFVVINSDGTLSQ